MVIAIIWSIGISFAVVCFALWSLRRAAKDGYPADMDVEPRDPWSSYSQELCMRESGGAPNLLNIIDEFQASNVFSCLFPWRVCILSF